MLKVGVLVSGGGTNLQAILDAIDCGKITNAEVSLVISNNPKAYALERAKNHNIEAVCISPKQFENREEFHSTASGKEVNEDAMVLEMISKDFKGLFTGDIGMVTEEKLIQNGCLEDVDFLKTAHHGSRYSTGAEFLEIVRPELAVVSCSATNTYGHPSPDTLERLKKSGSRVLITRDCGAVTIVNGKSVSAFNRIK